MPLYTSARLRLRSATGTHLRGGGTGGGVSLAAWGRSASRRERSRIAAPCAKVGPPHCRHRRPPQALVTATPAPQESPAHRESMLFMAGIATPSPMPMSARAANSAGSPAAAATGVIAVARLHHTTPMPSTSLPPKRSAQMPPRTWVSR